LFERKQKTLAKWSQMDYSVRSRSLFFIIIIDVSTGTLLVKSKRKVDAHFGSNFFVKKYEHQNLVVHVLFLGQRR